MMTSFAFILGVVPLLIARGAGAEMRQSLGMAVFSGMLGVTLFGIFLTPVFFNVIDALSEMKLFASRFARRVAMTLFGCVAWTAAWMSGYFQHLPATLIVLACFGIAMLIMRRNRRWRAFYDSHRRDSP